MYTHMEMSMKCNQCGYETMSLTYYIEHAYGHVVDDARVQAKREAIMQDNAEEDARLLAQVQDEMQYVEDMDRDIPHHDTDECECPAHTPIA
jgi:hypothetical protein